MWIQWSDRIYSREGRNEGTMTTWNLQEVVFRRLDNHEAPLNHLLLDKYDTSCSSDTLSLSEDKIYSTRSKSYLDVAQNDSEIYLSSQSSEVLTSASENEVYFQKLNARVVFPENYECSIKRKTKERAFDIGNFFGQKSNRYSKFIKAIKNQRMCKHCVRRDECFCQDESKVLLTALARSFFLSNNFENNSNYTSLTGSRKVSKPYTEKKNQKEKYNKREKVSNNFNDERNIHEPLSNLHYHENITREIKTKDQEAKKEKLIRTRKIKKLESKEPMKPNDREVIKKLSILPKKLKPQERDPPRKINDRESVEEELIQPRKVQQLYSVPPKKTNNREVVHEESIHIRKAQQVETTLPKKNGKRDIIDEASIRTQKLQHVGTKLSEITSNIITYGNKNKNDSLVLPRDGGIVSNEVILFPENIGEKDELSEKLIDTIEIASLTDLVGAIREKPTSLHEEQKEIIQKRHVKPTSVDASSSMPLKTFQSCTTEPKCVTTTYLRSRNCSPTKRNDKINKSLDMVDGLQYPIGDSGILNTYKKEIIYVLDKIIEEIHRLKLKKGQYKMKRVCFKNNVDTQTNQENSLKKYELCYSSSVGSEERNGCSYDEIFEGMDGNDYMQMLLRSKIRQMKGSNDIVEIEMNNQHKMY